jgi:hypothetical protein
VEAVLDITWSAVGKIVLAALGTYVFLPAALILRDYILWKLIGAYILNSALREQITRYAVLANTWNTQFTGKKTIESEKDKTTYMINGVEVSPQEFNRHLEDSRKLEASIDEAEFFIRRKSKFLNYLIKHYKQDATNPIEEWVKKEMERVKTLGTEKSS